MLLKKNGIENSDSDSNTEDSDSDAQDSVLVFDSEGVDLTTTLIFCYHKGAIIYFGRGDPKYTRGVIIFFF